MRSVFVCRDSKILKRIKHEVLEKTENTRLKEGDSIDDWVIIGEPDEVSDKIDQYMEDLGMNYLIASRIRVSGIDSRMLEESVSLLAHVSK
jgi:alkanesulfonate monooxygenase SsuD/methylene tetrahydromethanopterin reductase-like flavin-dependent oxidoreductase (luciferase family)